MNGTRIFRTPRAMYASYLTALLVLVSACTPASELDGAAETEPVVVHTSGPKDFPGAEGHRVPSMGGRGGRIIPVSTLADGGPGSLRECIEASGPSVCVFQVNDAIRFMQPVPEVVHDEEPCLPTVEPLSSDEAYVQVPLKAGAFPRDTIDKVLLADLRNRTGRIGTPSQRFPDSRPVAAYPDSDEDGMYDRWEKSHESDPARYDRWDVADGNGFPDFEDFRSFRESRIS